MEQLLLLDVDESTP
ncbi:d7629ff0-485f-4f9a-b087-3960e06e62dc [Thermothielavioides terrestris]|uniref:D7629ff0-485f-4f9a-b087-3960e06e62dc n=1 Tax=Thermothielavioides terrestris TaxID=2587410 RepID=A0A3S4F1Q2_9PEZI|nr:d7629ff0-485f-4f9a-b087-3960e06e62dc [Thermothielavioides terrestris]